MIDRFGKLAALSSLLAAPAAAQTLTDHMTTCLAVALSGDVAAFGEVELTDGPDAVSRFFVPEAGAYEVGLSEYDDGDRLCWIVAPSGDEARFEVLDFRDTLFEEVSLAHPRQPQGMERLSEVYCPGAGGSLTFALSQFSEGQPWQVEFAFEQSNLGECQ